MTLRSGEVYFSEQSSSFVLPETVSLFGFSISFYGLFLVAAALVGILVTVTVTRRRRQNVEWNITLLTIAIVCAVLGARLYYVLFEWERFMENPPALFNIRNGGLAYFGALFGAWFAVRWYSLKKNEDFFQSADILALGAATAAPFVWLGCFFVREPIGTFYDGVFAMEIDAEYLPEYMDSSRVTQLYTHTRSVREAAYVSMHPIALYGAVLSVLCCIGLFVCLYRAKQKGTVFTLYLVMNSSVCILLEFFRADRYCVWGTKIPVNYIVAGVILFIVASGWGRRVWKNRKSKKIFFIHGQ